MSITNVQYAYVYQCICQSITSYLHCCHFIIRLIFGYDIGGAGATFVMDGFITHFGWDTASQSQIDTETGLINGEISYDRILCTDVVSIYLIYHKYAPTYHNTLSYTRIFP